VIHVDIWQRPWAFHSLNDRLAEILADNDVEFIAEDRATIWIVTDMPGGPIIDGKAGAAEEIAVLRDGRRVYSVPLPLKREKGLLLSTPIGETLLRFANVPDAPTRDHDPSSGEPDDGDRLMARVKQVWARLSDVEEAIADPAKLWSRLRERWLSGDTSKQPFMAAIVEQARRLRPIVDRLDKAPRRILRRVHQQVPLSRVQEIDRHTMTWLIRQPGGTITEQAGDRQRIKAVVREENFNTLENRVMMSYARLADEVARDYAPSNLGRRLRRRELDVRGYGRRCEKLAADFQSLGVLEARPDATPNFVLQNNPNYHAIWEAWRELIVRRKILDKLWRWQARSWEEFCALALMVALQSIDGAELVATSPIVFRNEQQRGRWVDTIDLLGVIHLPVQRLIVEVQYGWRTDNLAGFCAPIWLRFGTIDAPLAGLARVPVWPIWDAAGGLVEGEAVEVSDFILAKRRHLREMQGIGGALILRPHSDGEISSEISGNVAQLTLGSAGESLREAIKRLAEIVRDLLVKRIG
jgi:hypothetical protein